MNLHETLRHIATDFNLNPDELIRYADADTIGGWNADETQATFPCGSIWGVEGQILYALICATLPEHLLELGAFQGCSRTHLDAAVYVNKLGEVTSVDIAYEADYNMDAVEFLSTSKQMWDFIFEDTNHSMELTRDIWKLAVPKLNPGGIIVSHDAMHFGVGANVRAGIGAAGYASHNYLTAPSDCGLALWRKPLDTTVKPPTRKSATKPRKKSKTSKAAVKRQAVVVKTQIDRMDKA